MPEIKPQPAPKHLDYLDAARGIAALMVMVYHFINWKFEHRTRMKLGSIIFNGSDAVSFFFVLSGFVLSYKYIVLDNKLDIRKFYITRIFRLWPAFIVIIILGMLNTVWNGSSPDTAKSLLLENKTLYIEELILFRGHPNYYIPGWTLTVELALSFYVPFWVFLAKKNVKILYWLILALFLEGGQLFIFHFILGVLLSSYFTSISDTSFKETKWYRNRHWLLAIAFLLFSSRHIFRIFPTGEMYNYVTNYLRINPFLYTGIGSFIFLAAIISSPGAQKVLRNKVLLFFGKISYGIYLCHWMFVVDVFELWDTLLPHFSSLTSAFFIIFAVYAVATILAATILHYAIELPFIRLGKKVANRYKPMFIFD